MNKQIKKMKSFLLYFMLNTLFLFLIPHNYAQEIRWLIYGETQCCFIDYGCEPELFYSNINFLTWPTQYGTNQHTMRQKGLWIGARNFYDPIERRQKSVKVVGIGPRISDNLLTMIFPQYIKVIGRFKAPTVVVDDQIGNTNHLYDQVDGYDSNLPCDRMIINEVNTSMGVTIRRKIMSFTNPEHDDYFIYEYTFKNTGIYSAEGDVYSQTLNDFWIYFVWRPAFAGITSSGWGSTWGSFASEWGTSTLIHTFTGSEEGLRGFYAYYGPTNSYDHPLTPEEDWGCPDHLETGVLGSAKYMGAVVLFAPDPDNPSVDDPNQPATDAYVGSDGAPMEASVSQFDETFMQQRWNIMTEGRLPSQDEEVFKNVGHNGYVEDWTSGSVYRNTNTTGSSSQGWGFGPYTLSPGDSIKIIFAEGVNGISWEKCREVGANWFAYFKDMENKPELDMPDGSPATSNNPWGYAPHNAYKRAWCETGVDSIMKVLRKAVENYRSEYNIPQPPPPPNEFTVKSGGNKIRLTWSDNATTHPHFDGYVIYRSEGNVKHYKTVYTKIFECDKSNYVHEFNDTSAARGNDYYYYIQTKSDGLENNGKPLYSSLFWTLTTVPAHLGRPPGNLIEHVRVVPNPYDIRARMWQFGENYQYDRIAFYELPPICKLKIFTERGDLIWEKYHDDGTGDELWDSMTSSGQIIVSGIYILYVEVPEDIYATETIVASRDYYNPKTGELEIKKGDIIFEPGDLMFKKGESVFRKFVVIR
ncbi:MAG: hypothetical protein H0Z29_05050 [Candidatus Marinimicrobia bacterium]|nr:hypothetical protein [Candidatus Neomarinimicrobiota bacterium]